MAAGQSSHILLVLDDPVLAEGILNYLQSDAYTVDWVENDEKAINSLNSESYQVLVTRLHSDRIDGVRLMSIARDRQSNITVILINEPHETEQAITLMGNGAIDYQSPPLNFERLEIFIQRGLDMQNQAHQTQQLHRQLDEQYGLIRFVGQSRAVTSAYEKARQAGPSNVPLILTGEHGTGKRLLAQAAHHMGPRSDAPFITWVCSPDTLPSAEQDLLGCGAGLLPHAVEGQPGCFELADEGTLYLDNLSQIPATLRGHLIELLALATFQRLGNDRTRRTDIRLIVSITPDLELGDITQDFLSELQHRFNAVTIELPPLRDRIEDIPLLVNHFIQHQINTSGKSISGVSNDALDILGRYPWPDNIRELENIIAGMALGAKEDSVLRGQDIPNHILRAVSESPTELRLQVGTSMKEAERALIEQTLKSCSYNKEDCAQILGIGLRTLYRKLKEYENS